MIAAPRRRRGETRCFVHIDVRAHPGIELAAMGGVALAIVAVVFLASDPGRAATEILVMTGDAAVDGTRLDSISAPRLLAPSSRVPSSANSRDNSR